MTVFMWGVWALNAYAAFYCGLWLTIHPFDKFSFELHWKNVLFTFGGLLALVMVKMISNVLRAIEERIKLFEAGLLPNKSV